MEHIHHISDNTICTNTNTNGNIMNSNLTSDNMDNAIDNAMDVMGLETEFAQGPHCAAVIDDQAAPVDYNEVNQIIQDIASKENAYQPAETLAKPAVFHNMDSFNKNMHLGRLLPAPTHLDTFKLHYRYSKGKLDYWETYLKELGVDVNIDCFTSNSILLILSNRQLENPF